MKCKRFSSEQFQYFLVSTNKKTTQIHRVVFVIPLGLEPRTHTLKVYCSTN